MAYSLARRHVMTASVYAFVLAAGSGGSARAAGAGDAAAFPPPDLWLDGAGLRLPARMWREAGERRGVVLALHGFTDSRDAWALPAPFFAARGYRFIAPDLRGFGATPQRGVWHGNAIMAADTEAMLAQLRRDYPGERLILIGESMGGAIAILSATKAPKAADAYVLLAPAVWGFAEMDVPVRAVLEIARALAPNWVPPPHAIPTEYAPTDNAEAMRVFAADPLSLKRVSVALVYGMVELMTEAAASCAHLTSPALVMAGAHDKVIGPEAVAAAWRRFPPSVRRAYYLNGYHLLLRDKARALATGDVLAWLDRPAAWLPSGADFNAAAWVASGVASGAASGAAISG